MNLRSDCAVTLIQQMGNDETIVRAARRSTNQNKTDGAEGLINYLMKSRHGSPFEHGALTIEVECPIFVAREWMRHRIGWSYSELSGRYSELEPTFWAFPEGRGLINEGKPARPKMGPGTSEQRYLVSGNFKLAYADAELAYRHMIDNGIAPEVARSVLPVGTYTNFWATCNPRSCMHFLSLRVQSEEAMFPTYPMAEINQCADLLEKIFAYWWPVTHAAFVKHGRVAP
jgi:thymidylate synthase (FAD)